MKNIKFEKNDQHPQKKKRNKKKNYAKICHAKAKLRFSRNLHLVRNSEFDVFTAWSSGKLGLADKAYVWRKKWEKQFFP